MKVDHWAGRLLDLLLPPRCRLCGDPAAAASRLCAPCEQELPWLNGACARCARPGPETLRCGVCQRRPPAFDRTTALLQYRPPVDYLLKRLKFSGELAIAPLLAGLLAERIAVRTAPLPALLIPVPLHRSRVRERGYNQAGLLARCLGQQLALPVAARLCARRRATRPQSLLNPADRQRNLRRAFAVRAPLPATHLAIVDDIMTTGHTAGALARALKRAGAGEVEVWVIARAAVQTAT
ncbi:MAG: ComF family protein [Pseudomonadota bacterium]